MQTKTRNILLVFRAVMLLALFIIPFTMSNAQEKAKDNQTQAKKMLTDAELKVKAKQREEALLVVKDNVIANLIYQNVQLNENNLSLDAVSIRERIYKSIRKSIIMRFDDDKLGLIIYLSEFDSVKALKELPEMYSSCSPIIRKYDKFGDEGYKNYGCSAEDLPMIEFRKSNFKVYVSSKDEKTTERFAGYVLQAIEGFAIKE